MSARQEILSSLVESTEPSPQVGVSAPVLFTEQEVAFSTAAALSVRPAKMWRWAVATAVVVAALHRTALPLTLEKWAPRRYYSRRYEFLENAAMAREMERL
jgi:hypothetical protein